MASVIITDHLDSIRAIIQDDGTVVGYTDYYPFGMQIPGRVMSSLSEDFYKYNGKQLDDYGLNWYDYGWRPYDAEIGRFIRIDRFAYEYPSLSPYQYAADNPVLFIDVNGDSPIKVIIKDYSGFIHGETELIIDHTYLQELKDIIQAAVENKINIHINSSFRTTKEQASHKIQKKGTTPASKSTSRHVAGFALDFNLYRDNDVKKGLLLKNKGQTTENNEFLKSIIEKGSRWGGNFSRKDPIHFDAGSNNMLKKKFGIDFGKVRDANQLQYKNRGVKRSINAFYFQPIKPLKNIPMRPVPSIFVPQ